MLQLLVLLLIPGLFGNSEAGRVRICENRHLTIYCGSKDIDIESASYGRTQKGVCAFHGLDSNIYCHAGTSMSVVKHRCQGQKSCTLYATNSAFGDPCFGTEKYLEVKYKCVPRKGLHGTLLQVCEGGHYIIHCHNSKKIKILSANYGRLTGGHICGGPIRTTYCGAAGSLAKVRADCQGRSTCVLYALNGKFGDPCYGTKKYLQVRYKCE